MNKPINFVTHGVGSEVNMETSLDKPGAFRLMRYFTIASLIAFSIVGVALYVLQTQEEVFFEKVQAEQTSFFSKAQSELSTQQAQTARNALLAVHEAGHVNLTRLLANMLWDTNIAPLVGKVQAISSEHCRAVSSNQEAERAAELKARQQCFAEIGQRIMALPEFAQLDAKAYAAMRTSTVFKMKVFDLRGITVYSSERAQVGEDKFENMGWKSASSGQPASELTHRDRFSAFEGVVENRDLISTYVPVHAPGKDQVVGVFEIYSDVTPFLNQIKEASAKSQEISDVNQAKVERAAALNQQKVNSSSDVFLGTIGGLLALLYVALLLIVRNGQRIIDAQSAVQEQSMRREQQWHREKMAALATMAAHVSHELGNPLATISGLAEDIASQRDSNVGNADQPRLILDQTRRIAGMIRQIADFAAARSETPEPVDVNQMTKAVCDFLSFDSRFRSTSIEFRPDEQLPACFVVPDYLNEMLIRLVQAFVEGESKPARIVVQTKLRGAEIQIEIVCEPGAANAFTAASGKAMDPRVESVRRLVKAMNGKLLPIDAGIGMSLPMANAST
jgi:signal transduction histidine kinase